MTKICHFTTSHRPDDSRIVHKELKSLSHHYQDVYLVTHQYPEQGEKLAAINYVTTDLSFPLSRLKRLTIGAWKTVQKALQLDADIYHFHDPELLPYVFLFKLRKKVIIYDAHEDIAHDILLKSWLPTIIRKPLSWLANKVEKFFAHFCSAVITVCDPITKKFSHCNNNTITINNFPDTTTFSPLETVKKQQVFYAGIITPTRGIKQAIAACAKANVKLVIAGAFQDQQLFEEYKQLPGWNNVEWLGYLPHEKINQLMNESLAGLLLLTHLQYFQPIKLYEYMAAGIPVIATDYPAWVDLVEKNNLGFCVDPNNIDEIARVIASLNMDLSLVKELGYNARQHVTNYFCWSQEVQKLRFLYDGVNNKI